MHSSPFMQALAYRKWAATMKIIGLLSVPCVAYWCAAPLAVSRKSVSHDTRTSAHIFRSSTPMRGLSQAPMKKS